jgi:glutaredoxin
MRRLALTLYMRPECHLCTDMKSVVGPMVAEFGASIEEIDISNDSGLEAAFGLEIPVLFVNGRKAFKYRVEARELRRRLLRESCR